MRFCRGTRVPTKTGVPPIISRSECTTPFRSSIFMVNSIASKWKGDQPIFDQGRAFRLQRSHSLTYAPAVTILEVIKKTAPYFEKQGIESPRLTIELLLAHLLKKKRMQLYLEFERDLDERTLALLREMVKRRVAGEPLQYITGETEFCGLRFVVDKRVLIPRPETELLVEKVVERLKATDGAPGGRALPTTSGE